VLQHWMVDQVLSFFSVSEENAVRSGGMLGR